MNPAGTPPHKIRVGNRSDWADKITGFPPAVRRELWNWVADLAWYDLILINTSAGKDSAATLSVVTRLATELGMGIDDATVALLRASAGLIGGVAGERIREELLRLLAVPGSGRCLGYRGG